MKFPINNRIMTMPLPQREAVLMLATKEFVSLFSPSFQKEIFEFQAWWELRRRILSLVENEENRKKIEKKIDDGRYDF